MNSKRQRIRVGLGRVGSGIGRAATSSLPLLLAACGGVDGLSFQESVEERQAPLNSAQLEFTRDCEDELTAADRELVETGFALLDEHRFEVETHINRSIAAHTVDAYTPISHELMNDWRERVALMGSGKIKVACLYNRSSSWCRNDTDRFGQTTGVDALTDLRDRVRICLDNIRAATRGDESLTAGVLAHELMHHVDGNEDHDDDETDPAHPETAADTIGTAMENLVLTPDLQTTIHSVWANFSGGQHELLVSVLVENNNPYTLDVGTSGNYKNVRSELALTADGAPAGTFLLPIIPALGAASHTFDVVLPTYEAGNDGSYVLRADADAGDVIFEADEGNNADEASFSSVVDLSLSVEVSGPARCIHLESYGRARAAELHWLEIPYRVAVKNLDRNTPSGRTDIVMEYARDGRSSEQVVWVPDIRALGTVSADFSLQVPTDPSCTGPTGRTEVEFVADGNGASVFDRDRSNNVVSLVVDREYWKPNYVVRYGEGSTAAPSAARQANVNPPVLFHVENVGPVSPRPSAPTYGSVQVLDPNGTRILLEAIPLLQPGADHTFEVDLPAACEAVPYTFEADFVRAVDESDETDNRITVSVLKRPGPGSALICTDELVTTNDCALVCDWDVNCATECVENQALTSCGAADEPCNDGTDFVDVAPAPKPAGASG